MYNSRFVYSLFDDSNWWTSNLIQSWRVFEIYLWKLRLQLSILILNHSGTFSLFIKTFYVFSSAHMFGMMEMLYEDDFRETFISVFLDNHIKHISTV